MVFVGHRLIVISIPIIVWKTFASWFDIEDTWCSRVSLSGRQEFEIPSSTHCRVPHLHYTVSFRFLQHTWSGNPIFYRDLAFRAIDMQIPKIWSFQMPSNYSILHYENSPFMLLTSLVKWKSSVANLLWMGLVVWQILVIDNRLTYWLSHEQWLAINTTCEHSCQNV